eukprot:COSAG05_NODE_1696_length_4261_cov_2.865596_2_plen_189_part_00
MIYTGGGVGVRRYTCRRTSTRSCAWTATWRDGHLEVRSSGSGFPQPRSGPAAHTHTHTHTQREREREHYCTEPLLYRTIIVQKNTKHRGNIWGSRSGARYSRRIVQKSSRGSRGVRGNRTASAEAEIRQRSWRKPLLMTFPCATICIAISRLGCPIDMHGAYRVDTSGVGGMGGTLASSLTPPISTSV